MQNQNYQNQQPLINANQYNEQIQISQEKYLPTLNNNERQNVVICVSNDSYNYRVSGMSKQEAVSRCQSSKNAVLIQCPNCGNMITTKLKYQAGMGTFETCCLLLFCGCPLCCWLPFCLDNCQNVIHICPTCLNEIGDFQYKLCC